MLKDLCRAGVEGMTDMSGSKKDLYKDVIASILSLIIALTIVAFIGKYLWNTTVAELFTFVRPVKSAYQIIGLMLFISLIQ
jgi:hypothetical protein